MSYQNDQQASEGKIFPLVEPEVPFLFPIFAIFILIAAVVLGRLYLGRPMSIASDRRLTPSPSPVPVTSDANTPASASGIAVPASGGNTGPSWSDAIPSP